MARKKRTNKYKKREPSLLDKSLIKKVLCYFSLYSIIKKHKQKYIVKLKELSKLPVKNDIANNNMFTYIYYILFSKHNKLCVFRRVIKKYY